jgi:disease resistance protein RPM1
MFPEDYELRRRRLFRHWITSGFIMEKENKTLEQVAEGYLNDLVNRSLLQVVEKNGSGRLKGCRMHDVIRHLALDKAAKESFGKVYEGCGTFSVNGTRRVSINNPNIVPLDPSGATHLRAIYVFTSSTDIDLLRSILTSSTLFSTLDLQDTKIKMLPNEVFSLFNLCFLGVRNTQIEILPETIGRLQNLEVLDATNTCLLLLPKDVGKLKKLRYLYASVRIDEGSFWRYHGVKMPRGIKNLTGLHALHSVKASSETLRDVAALTDLRTFAVDDVTSGHSLVLCSALQNMSNLVHLTIAMSNKNQALPLEQLSLPETLSKLELTGQLEKDRMPEILSSWVHLSYLTHLCLMFSKLDENSFPSLMVLCNLCFLDLSKAYDGKTLCFPVQSFPRLRKLQIECAPQLSQVEIEDGALRSLVELQFARCPELKRLPRGIEYLMALDELYLDEVAGELIKILRQEGEANECKEELMKIRHIRMVAFCATGEQFLQRFVTCREGTACIR